MYPKSSSERVSLHHALNCVDGDTVIRDSWYILVPQEAAARDITSAWDIAEDSKISCVVYQ